MILDAIRRLAANPYIYDRVQWLAGEARVHRYLAAATARVSSSSRVLDLGGGTGTVCRLFSERSLYVCLDLDALKLRGFRSKYPHGHAVLADATKVPIRGNSIDLVLCALVSHHLDDASLERLVQESTRVLKSDGTLVFIDAVWEPSQWAGRLLWKFDRGSHPRCRRSLEQVLSTCFENCHRERFRVLHEYLLWTGKPRC